MNTYIKRLIEDSIIKSAKTMPVIVMTGPRQSGKTTLAKHLFGEYVYLNLEFPDVRQYAEKDPRGFLNQSKKMIIDEIQRVPELFSYIQGLVDEDASKKYVLTGSNNFALMHTVSQSLAGRVGIFHIPPFSLPELRSVGKLTSSLFETMFNGFYPRVIAGGSDPVEWYRGYIQTYLERDIRDIASVHMLDRFYIFLRIIATRSGSILNYTTIASEVGVVANTIRGWVSILEASYIIYILQPYSTNTKKRMTKSPKIYFYDTGLLCSLLSISSAEEIKNHPLAGYIFENFVALEYVKNEKLNGHDHNLCFFRDAVGNEVDLVKEDGLNVILNEIKLHKTFSKEYVKGINFFNENIKEAKTMNIIYGGDISQKIDNVNLISWKDIPL